MMELRKTAGMSQKYRAEKAMLCASTLTNMDVLEVFDAALPMATPTAPTKNPCATMMGKNLVARSAARASEVRFDTARSASRFVEASSVLRNVSLHKTK